MGYELLHDTAIPYYLHSLFIAVRRNEVLYVTLNIPVVHTSSVLTVHKIKTHPVLRNEYFSHFTVRTNVADYIGPSRISVIMLYSPNSDMIVIQVILGNVSWIFHCLSHPRFLVNWRYFFIGKIQLRNNVLLMLFL